MGNAYMARPRPLTRMGKFRGQHSRSLDTATSLRLAAPLQSCGRAGDLRLGRCLHARLVLSGAAAASTFLANHLITMYSHCADVPSAVRLFDAMPRPNLVSWTTLVSGLTQNSMHRDALAAFSSMCRAGLVPTQFALSSAARAAAALAARHAGAQLHCVGVRLGFDAELFVASNLADMYSKSGLLVEACRVFDQMPQKDAVAWTAMIDGYAKNGNLEAAVIAFRDMRREGLVGADQHVLCSVLSASGGLKDGWLARAIHSCVMKSGFEQEVAVRNALTDMYAKAADMDNAARVVKIDQGSLNVVSATSLIDGYIETDCIEKALLMFIELRRQGVEPNEFTFSSMIKGCAMQALLEQGAQLHAEVIKTSLISDSFVSSTLLDMYGKCGLISLSIQLFKEIEYHTDIAWNAAINVLAQHGHGREAIRAFDRMTSSGIRPNHITFVSLLTACSHAGLVDEGLKYFYSMKDHHGIEPKGEHYSCIIDMYGRAGRLDEAEKFIGEMPVKPNAYGWCSLLGACRMRGNKELGEIAADNMMKLEPDNTGVHVSLSGIYASLGQWEDVKAVRKLMRDNRIKKLPGFSWVDSNKKTHVFGSEDWSHPQQEKIYEKLEELYERIKEEGYVPDTRFLPCNLEDTAKQRILRYHSERIAVAFALISMPATKPIIVKKNLRICADCHSALKFISKVENRDIIVRDNSRFHHFVKGGCSCGDYCQYQCGCCNYSLGMEQRVVTYCSYDQRDTM
ncbi:putative pentatricopeptide repeat-containing protein At5g52630 isoform X2 [Brachypodium distachyon]|uniref:putative pentatricopeptide repeat-containing protein At5g52630 isoform X2 n=1 Tax=Brachypodium distachyon TaxID=15368 RepID=UPI000D0DDC71|nr:putative pentatricopeptide repeat-containing protein At5g52630 isoform X2 [Brachypodium distachyon]|eukprot:XP_024316851.1 putative pentatricopeptide repeat-containing protein At5g52630 isoform X2 [Brachypodium distachyon]